MRRRIALISDHASPLEVLGGIDSGGQNVYVAQLARHLAAMGHEVDVFTRRHAAHLPAVADWVPGVRIVYVSAGPAEHVAKEEMLPHMEEFTRNVLDFCRAGSNARNATRNGYDIAHANFFMSGMVAQALRRELDIPFVITFHALGRIRRIHQGEADRFPEERIAIEDGIVAEADHLIAECPQDKDDLVQYYGADPSKITIVPCGFDPAEFSPISKPLARVALGLPQEAGVVLQVGRLVPRKGVDNVIRGFARFVEQAPSEAGALLLIVGGESDQPDPVLTPEIGRLRAIAEEEGVPALVRFTGRAGRDKLKYYYSAADVFVTTPWYEPFGITPLEAMACGTPVIGANVGGIKFSVRDNETGYLVPPNAPEALADALARVYAYPEVRRRLGRQAIRRVNELFTWQKVVKGIADLYDEVLAARRPLALPYASQKSVLRRGFASAIESVRAASALTPAMLEAAARMTACFRSGGKLLICGNGGSAADAQHFATEFMGRFKLAGREPLPAIALTADTTFLTAWSNDASYEDVFARQVEALARPGDVLVGISTSGRSPNVVRAFEAAGRLGVTRIGIAGGDGGELAARSDVALVAPGPDTQRVQEVHILLIHLLCELVEEAAVAQAATPVAAASIWEGTDHETSELLAGG